MARRGNRQLRPQPGVFLPEQGNLFRFLEHGGMVRGFGWRKGQIAAGWGRGFCFGDHGCEWLLS
jgi:hypothetical protein